MVHFCPKGQSNQQKINVLCSYFKLRTNLLLGPLRHNLQLVSVPCSCMTFGPFAEVVRGFIHCNDCSGRADTDAKGYWTSVCFNLRACWTVELSETPSPTHISDIVNQGLRPTPDVTTFTHQYTF